MKANVNGRIEEKKNELLKDEFEAREELAKKRSEIESFDDLVAFLKDVKENYNYDYGVAPRSIAQAALAVAWYLSGEFGITGFQAGCVMWDFLKDWEFRSNKTSLKILDYDNLLYPQYGYKFDKTISTRTWESVQKAAKENLESTEYAHPDVIAHWKSIVEGQVPFGFTVKKD
jgi:hypothetical protein